MVCPTCPFFPFSYFVYSYAHRMLCCHDQLSPVEDDGKRLINFLYFISCMPFSTVIPLNESSTNRDVESIDPASRSLRIVQLLIVFVNRVLLA